MHDIQLGIDPIIQFIIRLYNALGVWQNSNKSNLRKFVRILIFYCSVISYPVALAGGALVSNDIGDSTFLFTLGLIVSIIEFKGFYVFFKQNDILTLIKTTCTQSVPNNECLLRKVKKKLNISQKCSLAYMFVSCGIALNISIQSSPLFSHKMAYNIWFPLDYNSSRAAHWLANFFLTFSELFVITMIWLSVIMWCILVNCSVTYDILGYRLKHLGSLVRLESPIHSNNLPSKLNNLTILKMKNLDLFESQLMECIQFHKHLEENVDRVGSLFSAVLFGQIGTSAVCICGSVYFIATDPSSRLYYVCVGLFFYAVLDIFILMYLGNEIKDSSSKLQYCLFESNWTEQSRSCKSSIAILGEALKRHKVITVAKLYPLSLETFTSIMRGAYSMFNVLNNK